MNEMVNVSIGKFSIVTEDTIVGEGTKIWNYCKLYGCTIGRKTEIGSYCEIKREAIVGDNCVIKSYVCISKGVSIGNYVFIGPRVLFLNDKYPNTEKVESGKVTLERLIVKDNVTIGGGAIILPGVTLGKKSFIAAGSVVTKDVPDYEIWMGNPARFYKKIDNLEKQIKSNLIS